MDLRGWGSLSSGKISGLADGAPKRLADVQLKQEYFKMAVG